MRSATLTACAAAAVAAFGAPALSIDLETLSAAGKKPARVEVLSGWRQETEDGHRHYIGLKIELQDGWKTYWRSPGETGFPPSFVWTSASNAATPIVHFPQPKLLIDEGTGATILGYEDSVVFPIEIPVREPGSHASISGQMDYGVCREVCLPESFRFSAELPASDIVSADEIVAALSAAPKRINAAEVDLTFFCAIRPLKDNEFAISARLGAGVSETERVAAVFEYPDPLAWFSDSVSGVAGDKLMHIDSTMVYFGDHLPAIDRSRLSLTIVTPDSATEFNGCRGAG